LKSLLAFQLIRDLKRAGVPRADRAGGGIRVDAPDGSATWVHALTVRRD
jgi:hypothetical protein